MMLRLVALLTTLAITAGVSVSAVSAKPADFCDRKPDHPHCVEPTPPTPPPPSDAYCTDEVHAAYADGWHPQRDPSGCYFGHDHGSDPSYFAGGQRPTFGHVNHLAGVHEPHVGFKVFLLDDGNGHHWMWTVHLGSSGQNRVCARFHSVHLLVADIATGELLADIQFLGDFGRAEANGDGAPFGTPLTPDNCPTQNQDARADGSTGARELSINQIGPDSRQYEPWRLDYARTLFGLSNSAIAFNTLSAMTTCADTNCNEVLPTNHRGGGAFRIVQTGALRLTAPAHAGNFTTDAYGRTLDGAIPQYIKPGIDIQMPSATNCFSAPCNYWPGPDPNVVDYVLRSNDPAVSDGKGDQAAYNVDGMLRIPN